jgi:outer membrane beta-barrel protein
MMKRIALSFLFALTLLAVPTLAHAQHKSPLADAPAIRKRVELRSTRLELTAGLGTTINETFYHGVLGNVKLGFHFTDWLSISAIAAFNVSSLSTGFNDQLHSALPTTMDFKTPSQDQAKLGMNKMSLILGGQVELTPFTGKYSLFGKFFAHYDFYLFGGPALVNLAAVNSGGQKCSDGNAPNLDGTPNNASGAGAVCVVTGSQIGATYGAGFHTFFNNFLALNVELRDITFKDNPAGRDVNGDTFTNNGDLTWTSHLMATIGLTLYLPATADISP